MESGALKVSMKSLQALLTTLSPDVSICIRGRHAIGKSEGVYQAAEKIFSDFYKDPENARKFDWDYSKGLPVVERRLSQMTEGDTTGLPDMNSDRRATQFKPCDWLIQACDQPVVLFLDERNRALEAVKQAIFQLTDSKKFYGHTLHPETRVVIAENHGDEYSVQSLDPAEVSRCATVELSVDYAEWMEYAKSVNVHPYILMYLGQNPGHLEHTGVFEPNKKYPDRRSWMKLNREFQRNGLLERNSDHMIFVMAGAFLGFEVASRFKSFVDEIDKEISAADVLKDWAKAKMRAQAIISATFYTELCSKMKDHLVKLNGKGKLPLKDSEFDNLVAFWFDLPGDLKNLMWTYVSDVGNPALLIRFNKPTKEEMRKILAGSLNAGKKKDEEESATTGTRGARKAKK